MKVSKKQQKDVTDIEWVNILHEKYITLLMFDIKVENESIRRANLKTVDV